MFVKHVKNGKRIPNNPDCTCSECGAEICEGDVYYSHRFHHGARTFRKPKHICEACHDRKFIA